MSRSTKHLVTHVTFVWFISCVDRYVTVFRVPDWLNALTHTWHLCGFSTLWILLCLRRSQPVWIVCYKYYIEMFSALNDFVYVLLGAYHSDNICHILCTCIYLCVNIIMLTQTILRWKTFFTLNTQWETR